MSDTRNSTFETPFDSLGKDQYWMKGKAHPVPMEEIKDLVDQFQEKKSHAKNLYMSRMVNYGVGGRTTLMSSHNSPRKQNTVRGGVVVFEDSQGVDNHLETDFLIQIKNAACIRKSEAAQKQRQEMKDASFNFQNSSLGNGESKFKESQLQNVAELKIEVRL